MSQSVEILEDEPETDRMRSELFAGRTVNHDEKKHMDDATQMQRNLEREAERGTKLTKGVLSTAVESKQIATETVAVLDEQTRQLENVRDMVHDTHDNLARTEVVIEKLVKWKLRRAAERPFVAIAESVNFRKRGKKGLKGADSGKGKGGGEKEEMQMEVMRKDSYSDVENVTVRKHLQIQDDHLSETARQIAELRSLAVGMGEQIEYEAHIVASIDVPGLTGRIRDNHGKIRRGLRV